MKDRIYGDKICAADVAVIGAGASGLMAAISAARAGATVLVLEHTAVSAKKILSTGNGKCNFTNSVMTTECYRSDDPRLVMAALSRFSDKDAVLFFENLGVLTKSRNGYFYPRSGQAAAVRDALLSEAKRLGIRFVFKTEIIEITRENDAPAATFRINMKGAKSPVYARCCILASGGRAAAKTGSDGSGYKLAKSLGHSIVQPLPALVPLVSSEHWLSDLAGVRCDAQVSLYVDGEKAAEDIGEVQFTDYGISGIPVFQVSRFASVALNKKRKVSVKVDFFPDLSEEHLAALLKRNALGYGKARTWRQILSGFCNQKVAGLISDLPCLSHTSVCELSEKQLQDQTFAVARQLKETIVCIIGTRPPEQAQVTCGGVPLREVGENMQSKIVPGFYFAGEILNVDGICGGYNLQWAWTSGYLAGKSAAEYARCRKGRPRIV